MVSEIPALIVARKDFPPKDLKEFVSFVKANGDKLNVAHAGVGSVFFTTCTLLNSILNVKPTLVPFNGGGAAMNALVGGQVDYMCADVALSISQLQAGTIKALQLEQRSAIRCCRTCRHPTRPACRNSRHQLGMACSLPRQRPSRSSRGSPVR